MPPGFAAAFAMLAAFGMLYWRRGSTLTMPQVWDEDGTLIVPAFLSQGWITLTQPLGYLISVPRLISGAALTIAPHAYPLASTLLAWLFTAVVAAYVATAPTLLRGRMWLALACFVIPTDPEVFGTPVYTFWWAGLILMLLPFWEWAPTHFALRLITLSIFSLSSPIAILTAPLMAIRAYLLPNRVELFLAAVAILAAGVQLWVSVHIALLPEITWTTLQVVVAKFFGEFTLRTDQSNPQLLLLIAGIGVIAVTVFAASTIRNRWVCIGLLYLLAGSIAVSATRVSVLLLDPLIGGPRYFFYPYILLAWILIEGCCGGAHLSARIAFATVLVLALVNAGTSGWSRNHEEIPWARNVASCVHFESYSMPIQLDGHAALAWHQNYSREACKLLGGTTSQQPLTSLYPFTVRSGDRAIEARDEVQIVSQSVFGSNISHSGPGRFNILGSFVTKDSDTGTITLALRRGTRLLFQSGSTGKAQRYILKTGDQTFTGELPTCSELCTLDFSSDLLPDQFTVTFSDEGTENGEWFAVGVPVSA